VSDRVSKNRKFQLASRLKSSLAGLVCAVLVASCGKTGAILDPDPLAPFVQARYGVEGAVATFKQEFQPSSGSDRLSESDWNKYRKGRGVAERVMN
jgi:hypothetical protein